MFDHLSAHNAAHSNSVDRLAALREYVGGRREALFSAATLLAGRRGGRLVTEIAAEVERRSDVSRRCRKQLHDLLDILTLENVHDPDRDESGFFARLDPAAPAVEEICLLTDEYRDVLRQAELDHPLASRSRTAV